MGQSSRRSTGFWRRAWRFAVGTALSLLLLSIGAVLLLRWIEPGYSAVMLQRLAVEQASQHQTWVGIDEMAPAMALAVVAAEDQRFPDHWGFDAVEILAAVEQHREGGRLRGASTLSQQVARNLFLWQGRSFFRKGLEVWFTALIETLWSKRRILEMYLNFAETGERLFGVEAASQRYFDRSARALGRQQAALIAAVLPNPVLYQVDRPSAYVRQRQQWILQQMDNLGGTAYLDRVLQPSRGN
jgi:monofunctional biosynthetic peptidoglycan transglycosylase